MAKNKDRGELLQWGPITRFLTLGWILLSRRESRDGAICVMGPNAGDPRVVSRHPVLWGPVRRWNGGWDYSLRIRNGIQGSLFRRAILFKASGTTSPPSGF